MSSNHEVIQVKDLNFALYLTREAIQARVEAIGAAINEAYQHKNPIMLAILNGSFVFAADLVRQLHIPCELSFIKIASYEGTKSSDELNTLIGINQSLEGRHVIIIEDIIDSGKTMHHLLQDLNARQTASVAIATLLLKPECLIYPIAPTYTCFSIPPAFVVGYGLDYDGQGRNLPQIYSLLASSNA